MKHSQRLVGMLAPPWNFNRLNFMAKLDKSRLARAVDQFNQAFGHDLRLPATVEVLERISDLCVDREREDIARELRAGMKEAAQ